MYLKGRTSIMSFLFIFLFHRRIIEIRMEDVEKRDGEKSSLLFLLNIIFVLHLSWLLNLACFFCWKKNRFCKYLFLFLYVIRRILWAIKQIVLFTPFLSFYASRSYTEINIFQTKFYRTLCNLFASISYDM